MSVRHSRRNGSTVQEGNRRVSERLKLAETFAEEGNVEEAWRNIRLAIERLYIVVNLKQIPGFEAETWYRQGAEYMWVQGVGTIIEGKVPGSGKRLKEILNMTAGGAHDVQARGTTDIHDAANFIRTLLSPLQIGG